MNTRTALSWSLVAVSIWTACGVPPAPPPEHRPEAVSVAAGAAAGGPRGCIQGTTLRQDVFAAEREGREETVDILETPFKYPFLARWRVKSGRPAESATWAVATHLLVTFDPDPGAGEAQVRLSTALELPALEVQALPLPGTYLAEAPWQPPAPPPSGPATYLLAAAPIVRSIAGVRRVSPDYLYFSISVQPPNDPYFWQQDDLVRIGALDAWATTTGSRAVRVAVLDTGIATKHPDLVNNLARRPDGSIDGKDIHNGQPVPEDDNSHGTYCSGIIGAEGNNGVGIAGVNWYVSIVPVKILDQAGCGTTDDAIKGIQFALDEGATVLSNSWGGAPYSQELEQAVLLAATKKVLFVAGAGNDDRDLAVDPFYPAALPDPNVISVGGTLDDDTAIMTYGHSSTRVHLSAPAAGVFSTVLPPRLYAAYGGTSAAAAFVAGACALLEAQGLTYLDVRSRLLQSSKPIQGTGASCSQGRLDLANAVSAQSLRAVNCP